MNFNEKKIAILGYGLEGRDAEKFFIKQEITPTILDQKDDSDYLSKIKNFDIVVRSPGVYRFKKEILDAENNGIVITSAIKIFFDECPGKIIGVTGTKGKGTTSTLIYEILKADGQDVYLSGNIGKPYLELLPKLNKDSWIVMEMSSFQLIDLDKSPHVGVILNITPDHMDWHKNVNEYIEAKENIVSHMSEKDFAVINEEYESSKKFADKTKGQVIFFSKQKLDQKYKSDLLLRGEHNLENIAAAAAVCKVIGVEEETVVKTVKNFKGLEHRLELVDTINGVTFYNDSFATGPQPTIAAIRSFSEPETLILGGSDKGLEYSELGKIISKKENAKNVILIGETKLKIENSLKNENCKVKIVKLDKTNMKEIVEIAFKLSKPGEVVILSPASASFDMFKNYKERGNEFKKAVKDLQK